MSKYFFINVAQFFDFPVLFFRARPELVEGFLRALEDILRQAQDEREEIFIGRAK